MKIEIKEVWNGDGKSQQLVILEVPIGINPYKIVREWIWENRRDLELADGLFSHGYCAREI